MTEPFTKAGHREPNSEPKELAALEKATNDAAGKAGALWLSFISFALLVMITTGTVTHKHLLLELPLKLPVLNVDLPLDSYFFFSPLIFLLFHFYLLLQLDGLAAKTRTYNAILHERYSSLNDRQLMRQRLDSSIFVQMLVGARERREGLVGWLNRATAGITVAALPLATLLVIQLAFLPYHSELLSSWHRLCILADVTLIWIFRSHFGAAAKDRDRSLARMILRTQNRGVRLLAVVRRQGVPRRWRTKFRPMVTEWAPSALVRTVAFMPLFSSLILVVLIFAIAHPEERIYRAQQHFLGHGLAEYLTGRGAKGTKDLISIWTLGLNCVILESKDIGVDAKILEWQKLTTSGMPNDSIPAHKRSPLSLADRHLERAVLNGVDLRQVDFSRAKLSLARFRDATLNRASFDNADLREAQFEKALMIATYLRKANLTGAELSNATLNEANFDEAQLANAKLNGAILKKASFVKANLTEADLSGADIEGTKFDEAILYRTRFDRPILKNASLLGADARFAILALGDLQGAQLSGAKLEGTSFRGSNLQGAKLERADLRNADLQGANLQNADLSEATLEGANLTGAQLQGATLTGARLQGAKLDGARLRSSQLTGMDRSSLELDRAFIEGDGAVPFDIRRRLEGRLGTASLDRRRDIRGPFSAKFGCEGDTVEANIRIAGVTEKGDGDTKTVAVTYAGRYMRQAWAVPCVATGRQELAIAGRYEFKLTATGSQRPLIVWGELSDLREVSDPGHDANLMAIKALQQAISSAF